MSSPFHGPSSSPASSASRRPQTVPNTSSGSAVISSTLDLLQSAKHSIGNYKLGKTIGEGTFGKVKLAHHRLTNTQVAVKVVDKIYAPAVIREVETWRRLRHHPNIAYLYELMVSESKIYMVMEHVSEGEVFHFIEDHGPIVEQEAKRLFRQLVKAIQFCHDNNIVHRDLKLENVMLDKDVNVKLIDFGFTREYESKSKLLDTFCGSSAYAAPEMISNQKYSGPEADIWSLGVVLYTMICGYLPFDDDNEKRVHDKILNLTYEFPDSISEDAKDLVRSIVKLKPSERLSIPEILKHRWFDSYTPVDEDPSYLERSTSKDSDLSNFITKRSVMEKVLLLHMHHLGFQCQSLLKSLRDNLCDQASSIFDLLLQKAKNTKQEAHIQRSFIESLYHSEPANFQSFEDYLNDTLLEIAGQPARSQQQSTSEDAESIAELSLDRYNYNYSAELISPLTSSLATPARKLSVQYRAQQRRPQFDDRPHTSPRRASSPDMSKSVIVKSSGSSPLQQNSPGWDFDNHKDQNPPPPVTEIRQLRDRRRSTAKAAPVISEEHEDDGMEVDNLSK